MGELVDRPAIELARGDEFVARLEQVWNAIACAAWPEATATPPCRLQAPRRVPQHGLSGW
jgi:hypothetical protein